MQNSPFVVTKEGNTGSGDIPLLGNKERERLFFWDYWFRTLKLWRTKVIDARSGAAKWRRLHNGVVISSVYNTVPDKLHVPRAPIAPTCLVKYTTSALNMTRDYRYKYTGNTPHPRIDRPRFLLLFPPDSFVLHHSRLPRISPSSPMDQHEARREALSLHYLSAGLHAH